MSQTILMKAMTTATDNNLDVIVWLASNVVKSPVVTRHDKVQICLQIGKKALKSVHDKVVSDACWLYSHALNNCEDDVIE